MDHLTEAQLARWGLTPADASAAGLFTTPSARAIYAEMPDRPGLVIPYYTADRQLRTFGTNGHKQPFARIRFLGPDPVGSQFTKSRPIRYTQPAHSGVAPYYWPGADWPLILSDPQYPLIITEGEAKAIRGCVAGFTVIALGGVYSFTESSGEMLHELDQIVWAGRDVYVVYDSDAATNPNVLAAEARLVDELQRKRGAKCRLVRLPADGEHKQGLDDFINTQGAAALADLLKASPTMGALDAKILGLNKEIAWIEREGMIYDLTSKLFIRKENLINGSRYSTLRHITVGAGQRAAVKEISVAQKWLTHSHAQRFDEILFRPSEGPVIRSDMGGQALNMWTGFDATSGDVTPFLDLSKHMFSNMRGADADLPLKTVIYKAQNPAEKIPLALVMIGPEGSGKSLWGECVRDAFAPYGVDVSPGTLTADFQGWLETSLIALVNEAKGDNMKLAAETLRGLISDLRRMMNEKFRTARQINTYTFYIITANDKSVGAFRVDDRRMVVINAPKPREGAFYDRVHHWKKAGGPRALMGWMLAHDLNGWRPPDRAPMSAEKYIAYIESLTPTQRLAEEMQTAGQDTIRMWLDAAVAWAQVAEVGNNVQLAQTARATLANIQQYQIRPWYQPEELALMFPSIVTQLLGSKFNAYTPSGIISRELRDAGISYLECADDPRGFMWRGRLSQYLVISGHDEWRQPLRQADFERLMQEWPTYGDLIRGKR